ncbi:MAG: hypothetical protein GX339_02980 [Tissierellia bacterium]|nr:hypothetical protein [Tissierellia bacterium]
MKRFKKSFFLVALLSILILTACSENGTKLVEEKDIMATVNGKAILQEEFDKAISYYKDYVEYLYGEDAWESEARAGLTYKQYYEDSVMDDMIYRLLLLDAAEKEGITATEEEVQAQLDSFKVYFQNEEEYKSYLTQSGMTEENIKEELSNDILINHFLLLKTENLSPTDEEFKALFDELRMNTQVRASHILVNTEEEALTVSERSNNGEDFADLARELSVDTGSSENGGDLDYFSYAQMVKPFSEAAFSMEIGEISEPVESEFGYHIIKVTDKIVDEEKTVETEKDWLIAYYKDAKIKELLDKLETEAEIVKN